MPNTTHGPLPVPWHLDANSAQALVMNAVSNVANRLPGEIPWLILAAAGTSTPYSEVIIKTITGNFLDDDADPELLREVILQTYLFAGYPRCIEAMTAFNEVVQSRGITLRDTPLEPVRDRPEILDEWQARGEANCQLVYGKKFDALMAQAGAISPDLAAWMIREGYGRVLGRNVVPFQVRELCIIAALLPMEAERQLRSHMHGAVNVGASLDQIRAVLELVAPLLTPRQNELGATAWERVRRALIPPADAAQAG